jgi:hypothetical protein
VQKNDGNSKGAIRNNNAITINNVFGYERMKLYMKNKLRCIFAFVLILTMIMPAGAVTVSAADSMSVSWDRYMTGGQGVGFYDSSSDGKIEAGVGSVCLRTEEWVKYSITGLDKGRYKFFVSTANTSTPVLRISINDETVLDKASVQPTGSYSLFLEQDIGVIDIAQESFEIKIENTGGAALYLQGFKFLSEEMIRKRAAFDSQGRPYIMSYLPCIIQAENFDAGLNGIDFLDMDKTNRGAKYRTDADVDIYEKDGGGYYVEMVSEEWLKYTFMVEHKGNYNLLLSCTDNTESSKLRVYIDGYEVIKNIAAPVLRADYKEVSVGNIAFDKGVYTLIIKCIDGSVNFDYLRFAATSQQGIDISDKSALRHWSESQDADFDFDEVEVVNEIQTQLYVTPEGSDSNDGSEGKPFKTIERARQEVRKLNSDMTGDVIVNLSGEIMIDQTLEFTVEDSGTNGFNVIYRGEEGTVINGGKKVTGWSSVEGTSLYKTTLEDVDGIRQFYINDNRGVRSRSKWLYWSIEEYDDVDDDTSDFDGFVINGNDFPQEFSRPQDMEFIWIPSWKNIKMPVNKMFKNDEGNYVVTFKQPYFDASLQTPHQTAKMPFYIENAPEFLDEPGEWYFNRDTKELFYYPTDYEDLGTAQCYIPRTEVLLKATGESKERKIENITFEGISFKYGAWEEISEKGFSTIQAEMMMDPDAELTGGSHALYPTRLVPAQIQVDFAKNINFKDNEFAHLGSVALSYNNASTHSKVDGNIFDDISASAITLSDWVFVTDSPLEDFCRSINITNNLIRRVSVEYMTPAITAYYVNNVQIAHNDILDAPYTGISLGWGWGRGVVNCANNKIQNNRIENVLYKLKDGGHIYTLDPMKGTVISGNHLLKSGEWKGGIYHDNSSAYIISRDNVFEDCYKWMKITWHNIHDNIAYNNYCETPGVVTYPESNSIEEAIGKTNGEWPDRAKEIIANAGLRENYKHLLDKYYSKSNVRNAELARLKYDSDPGIVIPAGNYMDGGEGVAYHDKLSNANGMNVLGEPGVYDEYNGTNHHYIMVTLEGEWTKYKVDVPEDGEYEIILNLSVVGANTAVSVEIDDELVADKKHVEPNCTGYDVFSDYNVGSVYLEKGVHEVKIEHAIGNFGFYKFRLTKPGDVLVRNDGFKESIVNSILGR